MAAATLTPETAMNSSFASASIQHENFRGPILQDHALASLFILNLVLGLPCHMYVVWLITIRSESGVASEFFSLNLSVCEIIVCFASLPFILYILSNAACINCFLLNALLFSSTLLDMGRPLFQCCVCVERYVAVVHPVTFLKYKPLRYRLAFSAVVWFTLLGICITNTLFIKNTYWMYYALLPYYLGLFLIKALCCVSVLKVLRQSGPGWGVRGAEVNPMKKKAFWLMLVLLVTIVFNWCPSMFYIFIYTVLSEAQRLKGSTVVFAFMMSTGFVHPILYFHRSGKLPFVQH